MLNLFKSNQLNQNQAHEQLSNDPSIKLIDVRTKAEYQDGHIKGSVNIPLDTLPTKVKTALPKLDQTIFVVCYSGARASDATRYLVKMGYTKVYNMGGVATWTFGLVK